MVCLTASLVIVAQSIVSIFNGILRTFITLPFKLETLFIYGIFLLIVLLSLKTILARSNLYIYAIFAFFIFEYLISFMINGYFFEYYIELGIDILFLTLPFLLVTYVVRDYNLFKKYLYFSALLILLSTSLNIFVFKTNVFGGFSYDQSYTYSLLTVAIILCNDLFNKIKFLNIILFSVSVLLMFSIGARGPFSSPFYHNSSVLSLLF